MRGPGTIPGTGDGFCVHCRSGVDEVACKYLSRARTGHVLLSASALMSILWGFLECLKVLRMIVAFSAEMETSEYCMGWDPDGEVVALPILRKPWKKERNRGCRRYILCRWNPMEVIALRDCKAL